MHWPPDRPVTGVEVQIDCRNVAQRMLVLHLSGRLDFSRRQEFLSVLDTALEQAPAFVEVQVDCTQLIYIDSSGLGLLLILRDRTRSCGGSVVLQGCNEDVRNILNGVQFGRLFRLM